MIDIDTSKLSSVLQDIQEDPDENWLALATAVVYVSGELDNLLGYPEDVRDFLEDVAEATLLLLS